MSLEEVEKESTESDSDDETYVTGPMVESSRIKKLKKFDFITEDGKRIYLTKEQINQQKKIEEEAKATWQHKQEGIGTRMDYLHSTEAELEINLDIPLSQQDPLDKLNDLANKKRKHVDEIHDYFKANKRLKSSVQYEDHLPGTMLNEPVLGMIMFNSYHRQDFITIEDLKGFPNTMLYTVQEIFFRHHQGHGLDDHARTLKLPFTLRQSLIRETLNPPPSKADENH
ncbi:hypothetical protein Tco_1039202 [Tanacetum coccineum]